MITDGTIVNADINASAAIAGSKLADASVTVAKLASDVTPAMQSMIDTSIATAQLVTVNAQSGTSYTLVLGDASDAVECANAAAITLTVPTNASVAFPVGTVLEVVQTGVGQVTIAAAGGVTVNTAGTMKTRAQWSVITLRKRGTDTWILAGDLA